MRFSVITVTYNAERYLTQTLDSVALQQGVAFEHLVWDGEVEIVQWRLPVLLTM